MRASLRAGPSWNRIPLGARFSAPVQTDSGLTQPTAQWVLSLFSGGKAAGAWRWPPTPSSAEVKERVELHFPSGPSRPVLGWTSPLPYDYLIWGTGIITISVFKHTKTQSVSFHSKLRLVTLPFYNISSNTDKLFCCTSSYLFLPLYITHIYLPYHKDHLHPIPLSVSSFCAPICPAAFRSFSSWTS